VTLKNTLKSSVAVAALFAIAAPVTSEAGNITNGKTAKLAISGQIVKTLSRIDDGSSDKAFLSDGAATSSRLRWVASSKLSDSVTVGGAIEMNVPHSNPAGSMTLGSPNADGVQNTTGTAWGMRHNYVYVSSKSMGKLMVGQTSTAADGMSEANLGGTGIFGTNDLGGGYGQSVSFINTGDTSNPQASSVAVKNANDNLDHGSRDDTIRYDTPSFMGVKLKLGYRPTGDYDLGVTYNEKIDDISVRGRFGLSSSQATATINYTTTGSLAMKHDSGFNVAVAGGVRQLVNNGAPNGKNGGDISSLEAIDTNFDGNNNPQFMSFNIGYVAKMNASGPTAFEVKYNKSENMVQAANNDDNEGQSVVVAATQTFSSIGTTIGLAYAHHEYEAKSNATDNTYADVDAVSLMTVFKF
jgi:hypothetical protein